MSNLSEEEIIEEVEKELRLSKNIDSITTSIRNEYVQGLLDLYNKEKEKNKELNLENQALYESINCNDDNMLARRYEKLQKENEEIKGYKKYNEVWAGKYHLLSRKINGVLEDKIKDKIKELEEKKNKLSNSIEFYEENTQLKYHNLIIKIDILKDLLKEN